MTKLQMTGKEKNILNPIQNGLPSKCSIVLIDKPRKEETQDILKVVDKLTIEMHQIPIFMLIISDGEEMSPTLKMPIFSVGPGGHIVSFKCTGSAKITKLAVNSLNKSRLQDHCSFEGKLLRVAYNNVAPYFHVKSDQMDENSLEYLYLQTFIRKYKLIPELNFAGMTWGAKDGRTGVWILFLRIF